MQIDLTKYVPKEITKDQHRGNAKISKEAEWELHLKRRALAKKRAERWLVNQRLFYRPAHAENLPEKNIFGLTQADALKDAPGHILEKAEKVL